ncbi:hypothetical protein TeGR_g8796, partial [Tetraparma gracilis]
LRPPPPRSQDEETGYDYYYHDATETSQYSRPDGFSTLSDPFACISRSREVAARAAAMNRAGGPGEGGGRPPARVLAGRREEDAVVEEFLNGGWVKYRDDESGHEYYWNEGAQESTYDRPEGFQTHQDPFKGARASVPAVRFSAPAAGGALCAQVTSTVAGGVTKTLAEIELAPTTAPAATALVLTSLVSSQSSAASSLASLLSSASALRASAAEWRDAAGALGRQLREREGELVANFCVVLNENRERAVNVQGSKLMFGMDDADTLNNLVDSTEEARGGVVGVGGGGGGGSAKKMKVAEAAGTRRPPPPEPARTRKAPPPEPAQMKTEAKEIAMPAKVVGGPNLAILDDSSDDEIC